MAFPQGTAAYLYAYLSNETGGKSEVHFDDMRIEHEKLVPDNDRAGKTYRFAFNGKERDTRAFGTTTNYDYGMRIYSPAIAKFLSTDPLANRYPYFTPYQFASNMPINSIDMDGLESVSVHYYYYRNSTSALAKIEYTEHLNPTIEGVLSVHHFPKGRYSEFTENIITVSGYRESSLAYDPDASRRKNDFTFREVSGSAGFISGVGMGVVNYSFPEEIENLYGGTSGSLFSASGGISFGASGSYLEGYGDFGEGKLGFFENPLEKINSTISIESGLSIPIFGVAGFETKFGNGIDPTTGESVITYMGQGISIGTGISKLTGAKWSPIPEPPGSVSIGGSTVSKGLPTLNGLDSARRILMNLDNPEVKDYLKGDSSRMKLMESLDRTLKKND